MDKNWNELPPSEPRRISPVVEPYRALSEEWKKLYDTTVFGEEVGNLNTAWRAVAIDILFNTVSIEDKKLDGKELVQTEYLPEKYAYEPYLRWLRERAEKIPASKPAPPYIEELIRSQAATAGVPESSNPSLQLIKDFFVCADFYFNASHSTV